VRVNVCPIGRERSRREDGRSASAWGGTAAYTGVAERWRREVNVQQNLVVCALRRITSLQVLRDVRMFSVTISSVKMAMDFEIYAIGLVDCNWALILHT
jgi:hypothetical protein